MKQFLFYLIILVSSASFSQQKLSKLLKHYNTESIPYINAESLRTSAENTILLDSREEKEYQVSHLKNAIFVGYDNFSLDSVQQKLVDKNSSIVVYCSLGVRSEDIAEKLKKAGYTNVKNLYGGIFEWKNQGFPVYNKKGQETDSIHAFSKSWSKWLSKGIKIYE
ncbi:rhodanese-like domain-containing protein [Flavobacteriaceae bacterium SZ-1-7]|uniref:rhodanese-like domain-containing protein n=1 Tax=Tamlana sedimenti TaxID=3134126 RepID=UPI003127D879